MRAFITVIGKDTVGILAKVSALCAADGINITEVTQSVLQDMFAMIMLTDIDDSKKTFTNIVEDFEKLGEETGLKIHIMHEDIFNSMHRI